MRQPGKSEGTNGDDKLPKKRAEFMIRCTSALFTPISRPTLGLVFSPQVGNIWLLGLDYSIKPFSKSGSKVMENLQASIKGIVFFRSKVGAISEGSMASGSFDLYLGTEVDGRVNFRPVSDFGAALVFGLFIPNGDSTSPFIEYYRSVRYLARVELSISF